LAEQLNIAIENKIDFNPKDVLNIIEKTKNYSNQTQPNSTQSQSNSNVILPNTSQSQSQSKSKTNPNLNDITISTELNNNMIMDKQNYLSDQYSSDPKVPKYINNKKSSHPQKCNGTKCTYKCDSSYSDAISYLEKELKPLESFGNIYDNYASF
jgi:hypothetical protein